MYFDQWAVLNCIVKALYDWQTLVAAIVALGAAYWTIRVMRHQIRIDEIRHEDALKRKRLAARAQMPDALSGLGRYLKDSGGYLLRRKDTFPADPVTEMSTLKEVIEHIDDDAAKRTFELVSWYQVFSARLRAGRPEPHKVEMAERLYDAVLLQAQINSLFDYARNEVDKVDLSIPTEAAMENALKNAFNLVYIVSNDEAFVEVRGIIKRRHSAEALAKRNVAQAL